MKIISNKIKCLKCGDIIESKHRHDFKWCSCHTCAVDGGHDYLKRCGWPWEDLSEVSPETKLEEEQLKEARKEIDSEINFNKH